MRDPPHRLVDRIALLTLSALLVAACGRRIRDGGEACIGEREGGGFDTGGEFDTDDGDVFIDADDPGQVLIVFSTCSSGSVDWKRPQCEATVDGQTLTVTSRVRRVPPLFGQTDDCQTITTRCPRPSLAAGRWTLAYDDSTQAFDVPYQGPSICVGFE